MTEHKLSGSTKRGIATGRCSCGEWERSYKDVPALGYVGKSMVIADHKCHVAWRTCATYLKGI